MMALTDGLNKGYTDDSEVDMSLLITMDAVIVMVNEELRNMIGKYARLALKALLLHKQ